ncbi:MAG TPA: hypothetical protein VF501_09930, partial [Thiobacillus sp.]
AVHDAMLKVMRFWLERGLDGFLSGRGRYRALRGYLQAQLNCFGLRVQCPQPGRGGVESNPLFFLVFHRSADHACLGM